MRRRRCIAFSLIWVLSAEGLGVGSGVGLGVDLGMSFSKGEVDMIDLNSCVDQFVKGVDVVNEGEGTLDLRL